MNAFTLTEQEAKALYCYLAYGIDILSSADLGRMFALKERLSESLKDKVPRFSGTQIRMNLDERAKRAQAARQRRNI